MTEVLVERKDGIARVSMNRPQRRNGITITMLDELISALDAIAHERDIRVVVVRGEGSDFSVGADLASIAESEGAPLEMAGPDWQAQVWDTYRIPQVLHEMPQVTIAAVNGACAGAALGIACGADLRLACERSIFTTAFLKVGAAGDMSLGWTLPRIVGASKARELFFLPEKMSGREALEIGLVSRCFPDDAFEREVDAIAGRLAASAPLGLRGIKANFLAGEQLGLRDYIPVESERHGQIMGSEDVKEAASAFMQKRGPAFKGR
jgi:2-(1,2-epoxy-1,2-dihydrophenyl)acetyl-CoA isomerase